MYEWIKPLHVIAYLMDGGMLYLPRLFVYHCEAERIETIRDIQGDGAPAVEGDHQPGNDR